MSIFSVQARKHTAFYDHLMSAPVSKTPGRQRPSALFKAAEPPSVDKSDISSAESACEVTRLSEKSRQVNRTYVVSAVSKSGGGQPTPYRGRLALQRRSRRKTGAERTTEETVTESSQNTTPAPEKRLTLQRRTRTPSMMEKNSRGQRGVSGAGQQATPKVLGEPNGRTPGLLRSASLRETAPKALKVPEAPAQVKFSSSSFKARQLVEDGAATFKTPTKKTPFEKIAARREVFEKMASKETPKPVAIMSGSMERPKARGQQPGDAKTHPVPVPRVGRAVTGVHKPSTAVQERKTTTSSAKPEVTVARTSTELPLTQPGDSLKQQDSFKMENSAVAVAVRVRPFSARFVLRLFTPEDK